ncbi:hypothetical protein EDD15DRAFT_753468 [Pisolithus albus]|nr:hypothetical protein EDD15DRAFT_753468 [Pisolithus albus]
MVGIVQRSTVCLNEYGVSIWDTTHRLLHARTSEPAFYLNEQGMDVSIIAVRAAQSRINTARKSKRRTASSPFSFSHCSCTSWQTTVMLLNLSSWRTTPFWCWPAWKSSSRTTSVSTICRRNSKPCRTRHPVPVPAIVVWNPEVLDKGKNMWTSCRIRVTSSPNATASQPSIVHFGCA